MQTGFRERSHQLSLQGGIINEPELNEMQALTGHNVQELVEGILMMLQVLRYNREWHGKT